MQNLDQLNKKNATSQNITWDKLMLNLGFFLRFFL